ncbi:hypothetical protein AGOR_G00009270 [Albula goreensis]|uniref:Uncharacterized protein n=1 Tax=Albula goreensis TaxID=1534307 RepID=A0A8T3E937_9TELE|nr:hypothetical protein AGOR_G00009270 [Albula goreensis]
MGCAIGSCWRLYLGVRCDHYSVAHTVLSTAVRVGSAQRLTCPGRRTLHWGLEWTPEQQVTETGHSASAPFGRGSAGSA